MPLVNKIAFFLLFNIIYLCAQGVPYNQEFRISTNFQPGQNGKYEISSLNDGGFVVCWESYSSPWHVFYQIFNNDGSMRGAEKIINAQLTQSQWDPAVTALKNGGFVICWSSLDQEGSSSDVYAQLYDNNGTSMGKEFLVNTETGWSQDEPHVTALSDGGFVICWYGGQDVKGQLFNSNASRRGQEFMMSTRGPLYSERYRPKMLGLPTDKFIVSWQSVNQDGSSLGIFAQVFNNNGEMYGEVFPVNTYTLNNQGFASLAALSDSGFVFCWESQYQDGDGYGIFAQLFTKEGFPKGKEFRVNIAISADQRFPAVTALENDRFVICWQSYDQNVNNTDIYCQLYSNDGLKFGGEFRINDHTSSNQLTPVLSALKNGRFITCWKSESILNGKYYLNELNHTLNPFKLIAPDFDSTIQNSGIQFTWSRSSILPVNFPWELQYCLYLSTNESLESPIIVENVIDTTYTFENLIPGNTYFWKVLAKNINGDSLWSSETYAFFVDHDATAIDKPVDKNPQGFKLHQNYPNPFNPSTTIAFELASPVHVLLKIFDLQGREVAILKDEDMQVGRHQVVFNADNLASGVYYYMVQVGDYRETKKMLLLK